MNLLSTSDQFYIFYCPPHEPFQLPMDQNERIKISLVWKAIGNIEPTRRLRRYLEKHLKKVDLFQESKGFASQEDVWFHLTFRGKLSTWVHVGFAKEVIAWFLSMDQELFMVEQGDVFIRRPLKNPICSFPKKFPEIIKPYIRKYYPWLRIPQLNITTLKVLKRRYLETMEEMKDRPCSKIEFRRMMPFPILLQLVCILPLSENMEVFHGMKWSFQNPSIGKQVFNGFDEPFFDLYGNDDSLITKRRRAESYREIISENWGGTTNIIERAQKYPHRRDFDTIQFDFFEFCKNWMVVNGIIDSIDEQWLQWGTGVRNFKSFYSS